MSVAIIPDEGMQYLLNEIVGSGGNFTLGLYKNNYTPVKGSVLSSFTAADFSGYISQTITFGAPTVTSNIASAVSSAYTFTRTVGATSNTIYGWYLYSFPNSKVFAANLLSTPKAMNTSGDGITITLTMKMKDW